MSFFSYIYFFIFVAGIICGFNKYTVFIYLASALQILFIKEKYISLSLLCFFIAGNILSFCMYVPDIDNSLYECEMKIIRSYKYTYITKYKNQKFALISNGNFFEGDIIKGIFKIEKIKNTNNYNNFLINNGIYYNAFIQKIEKVYYNKDIFRLRTILINRIKNIYDRKLSSLINSVILGYRKDLTLDIKTKFQYTGIMHFLAISGLHVGILFIFIMSVLYFIPIQRSYKDIICIIILIYYAFLTYLNPPVIRAVMFLSIYLISKIRGYEIDWDKMISISAMFILFINPYFIHNTGFWLSFLSVYAIGKSVKAKNMIINIFIISVYIVIINAPLLLYKFGFLSFLSPLMTIIILPFFYLFLPISLLSMFLPFNILVYFNRTIFNMMEYLINYFSQLNLYINKNIDFYFFIMLSMYIVFVYEKKYFVSLIISIFVFIYSFNLAF